MTDSNFDHFIQQKPLFYKKIDHKRVHIAYAMLKPHIQHPQTVHLVGTNGKGSTGRIMASLLHHSGIKVGHFSSPHIIKFNERIWLEGEESSDEVLSQGHVKLYAILGREMSEALSYFEYTTLLALVVMEKMEVIILEAGLGGEFDATNVVSKALSVITPIGIDHQDFLGESIREIALTKLKSIEHKALIAKQPYDEVYEVAKYLAFELRSNHVYEMRNRTPNPKIKQIGRELGWADYLIDNAELAVEALKLLSLPHAIEDLRFVTLFGRFYPLLPHVRIDVGHNLLAAKAMVLALQRIYKEKKIVLVYNSLADKEYTAILRHFKPYIKRVEIIEIEADRTVEPKRLEKSLQLLKIPFKIFKNIEKNDDYLVFGSFYVVEAFLKKENYFKNQ